MLSIWHLMLLQNTDGYFILQDMKSLPRLFYQLYLCFISIEKKIKRILRSDSKGFAYILLFFFFLIWFLFPKKFCCLYLKSDILLSSDPWILWMEASWPDQLSIASDVVEFCTFFSYCPLPWREKREQKQPEGASSFYLQKNCKVDISPVWHALEQNLPW